MLIGDINLAAAEALAKSVGSAQVLHLDVTSPESIAAAVSRTSRLDILVNNAGIGHVGSTTGCRQAIRVPREAPCSPTATLLSRPWKSPTPPGVLIVADAPVAQAGQGGSARGDDPGRAEHACGVDATPGR